MAIYFTADLHLHHSNILRYCHRYPFFKNIEDMDKGLIANWNSVVSNADKVYHLGDFCFTKDIYDYSTMMHKVSGQVTFLRGNHDKGLQQANYYICRKIEGMKIFMRHWPPWDHPLMHRHSFKIPDDIDLILCGHVHHKWKYRVHKSNGRKIPVINIGTDVWEYKPVSSDMIMEEVERMVKLKHG
jgi:calcineurin-like phosphoesterase family protein